MARPKRVLPYTTKEISLPTPLVTQVDLLLYSQLEGKVPFAAWQKLMTRLLEQWVAEMTKHEPKGASNA